MARNDEIMLTAEDNKNGAVLTKAGEADLLNAPLLQKKVNWNTIVVGDGNGSQYIPVETQTELKNQVWSGAITSIEEIDAGHLEFHTVLPADVGPFIIREAGILNDQGALVAVCPVEDQNKVSSTSSSGTSNDMDFSIGILVSNAEVINVVIDPNIVIATRGYVDDQIEMLKEEINAGGSGGSGGASLLIVVEAGEDYNTHTVTATSDVDGSTYETTIENGKGYLKVATPGAYKVTNDLDEKIEYARVGNNLMDTVEFSNRARVFGIKVMQGESDPKQRVIVDTSGDLNGLTPITVDTESGVVNYGDMEDTFLFKAMNHVVLKSIDKQTEIELDPYDYSKMLDGGAAPTAELRNNYNTFARVDKCYIYEYSSNGYEYYFIADKKVNSNYTAIGFTKQDNSEADSFYMATHIGSYDSSDRLRSVSGVNIRNYTSFTDFATAARKNGDGYTMEQHQMINFYEVAYLMMFQNFDSQTAVGRGRDINGGTSSDHTATQTTGFANTKGPIAYDTDTKAIKFMHVEDLWFNSGYSWEEGWNTQNSKTYVRMKPPYITEEAGGVSTYTEVPGASATGGYIKSSVVDNKWGRCAGDCTGTNTTYECDGYYPSTSSTLTACNRGNYGLFNRYHLTFSYTNTYIVARLALLP